MNNRNIALKVEHISKCYRIGTKEDVHDSFGASVFDFIKSPIKNYNKYRSYYKFGDIKPDQGNGPKNDQSDIIWALKDVSFEVKEGEVVGIIGINGAGKSTLLKILSRITNPTSGCATIRGRISSLLEVGTGFHQELTGRENVYLNGSILGMRKKEIVRKFDDIVDFSGIAKFIDTPVKRYSSGMKMRLAFAVAAHLEPEILLIDEVLAVGDARFQKQCLAKMKDIGQHGRTVIFVSHNMPAVTRLCPRTILLNGGRVHADGDSHKIVSLYMHSEKSTKAERKWDDMIKAPGDEVVRLCAVRVKTEEGSVTDVMDIRKPIGIEMEYEVFQSGYEMRVYFYVINENGVTVFPSFDSDPAWRGKPRQAGRYVNVGWIPGNMLSEGTFFITPAIYTISPNIRRYKVEDAVAFQVIDSMEGDSARVDFTGNMSGVVRPLLKWETQFRPKGSKVTTEAKG
ncbi:MAG: ABC transporter ATP-binding protein [Candidatus Scalindua sp. AMX11]|nr:MAG: ABC transporter ATP-binding protein [Candidatus Scalindua sp.]NOG82546.1 ABC transporter ATP-binding protein [Planctomycetota bacterium]RZV93975.1 MAG: ABC transporter ATP-binding protein [Candidatus Scalindua sp. SCAELEC01]TDE63982.1 MAG: ABC transporter ATP-binding protein [Candidatus Scalindua sp. AMX11]GJQ57459.1 MAG: ABC transporter [Candidatus Scalindua sp.]